MSLVDLKLINYRGGLIKFFLPNTWIEEYESDSGGTFYEDLPDSGTLRLNVLTFENESGTDDNAKPDFFPNSEFAKRGALTTLLSGNVMVEYHKDAIEENEDLRIYYWLLFNRLPPKYTRIAVFSYTILKGQEGNTVIANGLRIIKEQIAEAAFALEIGK